MSDDAMDLGFKYWVYRVSCEREEYEDIEYFHIITEDPGQEEFYCPICRLERGKLFKKWKGHTMELIGEVTTEQILSLLKEDEE